MSIGVEFLKFILLSLLIVAISKYILVTLLIENFKSEEKEYGINLSEYKRRWKGSDSFHGHLTGPCKGRRPVYAVRYSGAGCAPWKAGVHDIPGDSVRGYEAVPDRLYGSRT